MEPYDVVIFGEAHNNYAVPEYLLSVVNEFKKSRINSFGFEIPVTRKNLQIIEEINDGNLARIKDIDWSLGFGAPETGQLKEQFVLALVQQGIKIYAFAHWGVIMKADNKYNDEAERKVAETIKKYQREGKTCVLAGEAHVVQSSKRLFPNFAQILKREENIKTVSIVFEGGMRDPLEYDRSPFGLLRRALRRANLSLDPIFITSEIGRIKGIEADAIIVLPERDFKPAR